jgi:hypothetical protein
MDGDTILFLRKAMALRGVEFAAMLRDKLLPPTARRDLVEKLAAIFQHGYRSDISISQGEIVVPK